MKTIASLMGWTCLISTSIVTDAQAADLEHIDRLAYSIKRQTALVCRELNLGFRRAPQYRHLYKDAYKMYQLADHMHEIAHHSNNLGHLRADASELDALLHHIQELIDASVVDSFGRRARTSVGVHHGFHSGGSIGLSGYHTRRLKSLVDALEDSVHHLIEDLGVNNGQANRSPVPPPAPPVPPQPSIRVPTEYRSNPSRGLSIPISRKGRFLFSLTIR